MYVIVGQGWARPPPCLADLGLAPCIPNSHPAPAKHMHAHAHTPCLDAIAAMTGGGYIMGGMNGGHAPGKPHGRGIM